MNHLRLVYIGYYENLADDTKLEKKSIIVSYRWE